MMLALTTLNERAAAVTSCDGRNLTLTTTTHFLKETTHVYYHDSPTARNHA